MFMCRSPVIKCCPWIPKRYIVMIFLMFAFALNYIYRFVFILVMANYVQSDKTPPPSSNSCEPIWAPVEETHSTYQFVWPSSAIGHSLAGFYYGMIAGLLLSGIVADRFGGKLCLTLGMLFSSLVTILTPLGFRLGYVAVICLRVPFGVFLAMVGVPVYVIISRWIPLQERGTWVTVVFLGINLGNFLNSLITPHLFVAFDEKFGYVFLLYGTIGLIFSFLFVLFFANDPDHDKFLSQKERDKLEYNMTLVREAGVKKGIIVYPWKKILTSVPVWVCVIANFGFHWYVFGITSQLPIFFKAVFHLDMTVIGYIYMALFAAGALISILGSQLVDYIERNKKLSTTANRKIFYGVTVFFPTLGLMAPFLGCKVIQVITYMACGFVFNGFYNSSLKINMIDFSPRYAGMVLGFCQTISFAGGIISNTVYGYIVPHNYLHEWQINFGLMAAIYVGTSIPFFIWGSGEIQPWNYYGLDSEKNENQPTNVNQLTIK